MEMKEIARKQKEKVIKEENDKIEAAIKAHEKRRQNIRGEVELESIARKLQEEKKQEEDKHFKRQSLTLGDLTKRIGKFKDILTQDLSDSEEEYKPPSPPNIEIIIQDINSNCSGSIGYWPFMLLLVLLIFGVTVACLNMKKKKK